MDPIGFPVLNDAEQGPCSGQEQDGEHSGKSGFKGLRRALLRVVREG